MTELKAGRKWTAERKSESVIRLLCNGIHLASVLYKDDCGGTGWKVNPMTPNHARSRKYWGTAEEAVRSGYGTDAAEAVREAELGPSMLIFS